MPTPAICILYFLENQAPRETVIISQSRYTCLLFNLAASCYLRFLQPIQKLWHSNTGEKETTYSGFLYCFGLMCQKLHGSSTNNHCDRRSSDPSYILIFPTHLKRQSINGSSTLSHYAPESGNPVMMSDLVYGSMVALAVVTTFSFSERKSPLLQLSQTSGRGYLRVILRESPM